MNKNLQVALFVLIVLVGAIALYYSFWSKPPTLTEEEKMQALIDSTTAPANSTPPSDEELKKLIDSTTAPKNSTPPSDEKLKKLLDSTTAPRP